MKKEIIFISVMTVFGIAIGLGIIIILASIAMPNYSEVLLTLEEKSSFEMMSKSFISSAGKNKAAVTLGILIILSIPAYVLFALNLNPNIISAFKHKKTIFKALVVMLVCLVFFLPVFPLNDVFPFELKALNIISFLLSFLLTGFLWFFAGETGWAGDFSTWRMSQKTKPLTTFLLGGIVGIVAHLLSSTNNWAFSKYFILVSEVLDKSGEVSYLGFKLLAYELMFMSGISLCILAGVVVALSPTCKETRQRIRWIIFPTALLVILISILVGIYQNASVKYDLNKKSLAEAVGIPEKASISKTIVILTSGETTPQEWPMLAKGNNFMGTYTIELSYENLEKVESYITNHKDGSVYNYAARDALINGYHTLWNIKKGIEWQFRSSNDMLLPRMILLARLKNLPVTDENLNYLKTFSDKSKWYIGNKYRLRLAEAFMHFGIAEEARALVDEAKEKGADISKASFINEPVFTNGKISGTVKINGKAASNIKIALLEYSDSIKKFEDVSLIRRLLDVRESDLAGKFSFEYLGKGNFMLAIMTNKERIPYNISQEKFKVINSPGKIKLDPLMPNRNLGNINIVIKK